MHQEQKGATKTQQVESLSSDEEMKEEVPKVDGASEKQFKNKKLVAESKLMNKRNQKEALKKNKMKRQKGV